MKYLVCVLLMVILLMFSVMSAIFYPAKWLDWTLNIAVFANALWLVLLIEQSIKKRLKK